MSYGVIKKKAFDILSYRISIFLNGSFDLILGLYFLFTWIYYGEPPVSVVVVMIGVLSFLLFIPICIYFITKKSVIFSKENVIIGDYQYEWHNLNLEFNFDIIPPIWNTICITYYDYKKSSSINLYIKCKKYEFDAIMSLRN